MGFLDRFDKEGVMGLHSSLGFFGVSVECYGLGDDWQVWFDKEDGCGEIQYRLHQVSFGNDKEGAFNYFEGFWRSLDRDNEMMSVEIAYAEYEAQKGWRKHYLLDMWDEDEKSKSKVTPLGSTPYDDYRTHKEKVVEGQFMEQNLFQFPNKYVVSCVKHPYSEGYKDNYFEFAVFAKGKNVTKNLFRFHCYDCTMVDLTESEVIEALEYVEFEDQKFKEVKQ